MGDAPVGDPRYLEIRTEPEGTNGTHARDTRRRGRYTLIRAVENKTLTRERTFSEIKRLSSAGLEGPELLRRTAERLRRTVPFEAYCVGTLDPASNLMTYVLNGGGVGEEDRTAP